MRQIHCTAAICGLFTFLIRVSRGEPANNEESAIQYLFEHRERLNSDLMELAAIPSVSALPQHAADILNASKWLRERLSTAGLQNVQVLNTSGLRPVVYADHLHASGAPTVLIYGHYDVQPADPIDAWDSPPFQPEVRGGALFARGADDDKGGLLPPIQAVEAILRSIGSLPVNVKFMLEGEEEVGSPFLAPFLELHASLLSCDFVLSADGNQLSESQPSLTLGLRGAAALEVEVTALKTDVHSGMVGGAVQNPAKALVQLLSTLHNPNGSVAVPGFYDRVSPITDADRDDMLAYNYDEQSAIVDELGAVEPCGEDGYSTLERIWFRPTLEVVGINGGFSGEGIKTVIPASARAKLAARLVPGQEPERILELIEAHIKAHHPPACNVTIRELGFKGGAFTSDRHSMSMAAAAKVLEEVMGKPPLYVRGGATIPALAMFQKYLHVDTTVFAFGLPNQNIHAPNEHMRLSMFQLGQRAYVKLLFELGRRGREGAQRSRDEL